MAEQAIERITIDAPPARVHAVAVAVEQYPDWAADVKEVDVLERDGQGRPVLARFRAAAMGHSATYVLRYEHGEAPARLAWRLERGDIVRVLDGEYRFEPAGDGTEVTYRLAVELAVPLPGFVKRRAESKIVRTALADLKDRAEG